MSSADPPRTASETADLPDELASLDEQPSLTFRIVRSLMLLASSIVVVVALPLFAWQTTSLAEESVEIDGVEMTIRIVKRHGELAIRFEPAAGDVKRFPLLDADGRSLDLDGKPTIRLQDSGRIVVADLGNVTRRFEFQDGAFVPVDARVERQAN